ncbi:peptidyl-tRNA hydrolase domain-containing protein, partial [Lojkania enalia]
KQLPPRRVILDSEIEENFLKGSGPGGQKINKTSSAVQLKHLPTGIVIKIQETRSRSQNRKIARQILGERIEELELGEQSRTAIKARVKSKKKASADKKKRRKYRELAAAKPGEVED